MKKNKIIGMVIGCVAVGVIGAAVIIGSRFMRTRDPESALISAIVNTYGEVKPPDIDVKSLFVELINSFWQQDVTIGVNKLSGSLLPLDASTRSIAEVLTLKNTTRRDTAARALNNTLSVQFAVTPLAELNLYGSPDILAFNVPQAFDYYITLEPQQVVREWDTSLLGTYLFPIDGIIVEDAFYKYYQMLLFTTFAQPSDTAGFIRQFGILNNGTEYAYEGQENLQGNKIKTCDLYKVTVPESTLNAYWQAVKPAGSFAEDLPDDLIGEYLTGVSDRINGLRFNGDLIARVYVCEGKISGLNVTVQPVVAGAVWDLSADILFSGELANLDKTDITVQLSDGENLYHMSAACSARVGASELFYNAADIRFWEEDAEQPVTLSWDVRWDSSVQSDDNFTLTASAGRTETNWLDVSADGSLVADTLNKNINANLKNLSLVLDIPKGTLDASLSVKYLLRNDDKAITYNKNGAVPLTRVGELDVLAMYNRIKADPVLNRLLQ